MKNNKQKKGDLGQHWTPPQAVDFMWSLIDNKRGKFLEPSAGNGAIVNKLISENVLFDAVEYDKSVIPHNLYTNYTNEDFFSFDKNKKYNCIIGNPPYVNGKIIADDTKKLIQSKYSPATANLYLHFIEKCVVNHLDKEGEIIFIIPSSFLSKTSYGKKLRSWMCKEGAFTHYYEKEVVWQKAKVKTCIFRWVKGKTQGKVNTHLGQRNLFVYKGNIKLLDYSAEKVLEDYFHIGVGTGPHSSSKSNMGVSFIHNKKITYYDMSDTSRWSRVRYTGEKHKILFCNTYTRDHQLFYNTVKLGDDKQASRHICHFMIPKFSYEDNDLDTICDALNTYINKRKQDFNLVDDGRLCLGISECKSLPVDSCLERTLKCFQ